MTINKSSVNNYFYANGMNHKNIKKKTDGNNPLPNANAKDKKLFKSSIKDIKSGLKKMAFQFNSNMKSLMQSRNPSNDQSVSVSITHHDKAKQFFDSGGSINLDILSIAAGQKNKGNALTSETKSKMESGTHEFTIEKNGVTHKFSVFISKTDDNKTIQTKMAEAINKKDIGVNAFVSEGTKKSQLEIHSNKTGESQNFIISDAEKGNIINYLGVGKITQNAQDAVYLINGKQFKSSENTIDVGHGIKLTLHEMTIGSILMDAKWYHATVNSTSEAAINEFNKIWDDAVQRIRDYGSKHINNMMDELYDELKFGIYEMGLPSKYDEIMYKEDNPITSINRINKRPLNISMGSTGLFLNKRI